jgi:anthranilate/para-aminobenzoate synthase component I
MAAARPLNWSMHPLEVLRRWPREVPLAALLSGDASPWSRTSVIAAPGAWRTLPMRPQTGPDEALAWIRSLDGAAETAATPAADAPPLGAGWFVQLSYELGGVLEPAARVTHAPSPAEPGWPLAQAARCDRAFIFDHARERWWSIGGADETIELRPPEADEPCAGAALHAETSDAAYARAVARTVELIRAGDLFQANIARRWRGELRGSPRGFAHRALASSAARYGAWLETPAGMLASMSPELFLEVDPQQRVAARPIKGTRRSGAAGAELAHSAKDAAELHMIVDLMRNDLARSCRPGSVRVHEPRTLETHRTVVHGVAEIHGRLREGCDRAALLAGSFPPGSITGAPKIRSMQVIGELEAFERGPYCGAIGHLADTGGMTLSVAIRTAVLRPAAHGAALTYAAGCGITSDSRPDEEVAETHAKLQVMLDALRAGEPSQA